MDEKTFKRLEFDRVRQQLARHAVSPLGAEQALAAGPLADRQAIEHLQQETSQAVELLRREPAADLGGWLDVRRPVQQAGQGLELEPLDLYAVGQTLAAARRAKKFLVEREDQYPLLGLLARQINHHHEVENAILKSILPGGEIADQASAQLAAIRRQILGAQARIKSRLEEMIRSPQMQKYLQDPIVTVREGRYVVPVKVEYRAQVPGLVHDQSASGATLFIEPMGVVEANNELRALLAAEKQEVARIIRELSRAVGEQAGLISETLRALAQLDYALARARYSRALDGLAPEITGTPELELKSARHPLLTGEVVPVSLHLGREFDTLVITGPNTGGKTVALKTTGLCVLMALSGMHIPAAPGSRVGLFRQVFADIGDEQSIEQSLSTFSSHMTNIVGILQQAGPGSLVLLDELGSGTDPTEGAALARAILEELHTAGARTVATTHYSELKDYAYSTPRVENASVEFDVETLRPTYRLLIGRPGRSNAFEIARRLGLAAPVVERARSLLSREQRAAADLMQELEKARQQAEADRQAAAVARRQAEELQAKTERLEQELREKKQEMLQKAAEEARLLVKNARQQAEEIIRELREKAASQENRQREQAIAVARQELQELQGKIYKRLARREPPPGQPLDDVQPGQEVFIPRFGQPGLVLAVDGQQAQVQVGVIKVNVSLAELRAARPAGSERRVQLGGLLAGKAKNIETRLDLRGMTADEALPEIDKYLDDAFLAGLKQVQLVHGKGTGALRSAVQQHLKKHPRVKSFRLGEQGEGGLGVTVVELP
ncbi:MAG: endonuclease MutS2 [Desulfurispora sp.]|uniref:endonuclease MutS2 n=1 Tax=Desulfurispora sp. TaxID=3014275 RepID=UPI00404916AE